MKKRLLILLLSGIVLVGCASYKREVYIVPVVAQQTTVDEVNKIRKVYYSRAVYDKAPKFTAEEISAKGQAGQKLPSFVIVSGTIESKHVSPRLPDSAGLYFLANSSVLANFTAESKSDYDKYKINDKISGLFCAVGNGGISANGTVFLADCVFPIFEK